MSDSLDSGPTHQSYSTSPTLGWIHPFFSPSHLLIMSALQVKYGDEQSQAPGNRVPELNHQSDNINHGFGGR